MEITAQHIGHYIRVLAGMLNTFVFVLDVNSANGMVQVRHMDGSTGWGFNSAFAPVTEDEELAAAIEWSMATGQLVDAAEALAAFEADAEQAAADEAARLAYNEYQQDEAAQANVAAAAGLDPEASMIVSQGEVVVGETARCAICGRRDHRRGYQGHYYVSPVGLIKMQGRSHLTPQEAYDAVLLITGDETKTAEVLSRARQHEVGTVAGVVEVIAAGLGYYVVRNIRTS